LDGKLRAKVGDFGLSGKVSDYSEYDKKEQNVIDNNKAHQKCETFK